MFPEAVRLAAKGYHFEKMTRHTIAVEDFRNFLAHEMDTFKKKISQFAHVQDNRIHEIHNSSLQLSAQVKTEYALIHEDFQYAVHSALADFQTSVFQEYLDAELRAFKNAIVTFTRSQTEWMGELQTYIHDLFTRIRAQHEQLHDDSKQNVQESFDAFWNSIQQHLGKIFGSVPVQAEELSNRPEGL